VKEKHAWPAGSGSGREPAKRTTDFPQPRAYRGQLSIELLLAGALLAATALLASNYVSAVGESTGQASKLVQAGLLAAQIARVANAACVSGASVSLEIECPTAGFADVGAGASFTVAAGGAVARARAACPISKGVLLDCSSVERQWLCISNADGEITVSGGRCG